jgi:two-component sensor histidine kinase/PAS domain-containing protein
MVKISFENIVGAFNENVFLINDKGQILANNLRLDHPIFGEKSSNEKSIGDLKICEQAKLDIYEQLKKLVQPKKEIIIESCQHYFLQLKIFANNLFLLFVEPIDPLLESYGVKSKLIQILENELEGFTYKIKVEGGNKKIVHISEGIKWVYGVSVEEYISQCEKGLFLDRIHPDDLYKINELNKNIAQNKERTSIRYRVKNLTGASYQWFEEVAIPVLNGAPESFEYYGVVRNINKKTELTKSIEYLKPSFVESESTSVFIENLLALCAKNFNAERSYLYKLWVEPDTNEYLASQVQEFTTDPSKSQINNIELQELPIEKLFPELIKQLKTKHTFVVNSLDYQDNFIEEVILNESTKTVVLSPVFVKGNLWGFLGIDSVSKKDFSLTELISIEIYANLLAVKLDIEESDNKTYIKLDAKTEKVEKTTYGITKQGLDAYANTMHILWVVDVEGKLVWFNQKYAQEIKNQLNVTVFKGEIEPLLGKTGQYQEFESGGIYLHFEKIIINQKGIKKYYDIHLQTYLDSAGKFVGVSAIAQEISIRKFAEKKIKQQAAKMSTVFESTDRLLIFTIDQDNRITGYNQVIFKFFLENFFSEIQIGELLPDFIFPFLSKPDKEKFEVLFNESKKKYSSGLIFSIETKQQKKYWFEIIINPIKANELEETAVLFIDVTAQKQSEEKIKASLKEKEVLLQEVHHRVKNNMQIISSMLNLQINFLQDPELVKVLRESQGRIQSMAQIHENLYQNKNFETVNFAQYIKELCHNVSRMQANELSDIHFDYQLQNVEIDLEKAVPCGLILNEIVTNSIKHAFKNVKNPTIKIELFQEGETIRLTIADNGLGISDKHLNEEGETLGMQLIFTLVEQIDANLRIDNSKGTKFQIGLMQ